MKFTSVVNDSENKVFSTFAACSSPSMAIPLARDKLAIFSVLLLFIRRLRSRAMA